MKTVPINLPAVSFFVNPSEIFLCPFLASAVRVAWKFNLHQSIKINATVSFRK
jgi:hypothetical protein